jgi:transcriptional regulator with XRE-family HTH domain
VRKLIGVQKAQISRLENNASNVTIDTLLRVFKALKAKVKLQVELPNLNIIVGK